MTEQIRNVAVIGHPGAADDLDLPMRVEEHKVIVIGGYSSHVCCRSCGTYFDIRASCPRCGQSW